MTVLAGIAMGIALGVLLLWRDGAEREDRRERLRRRERGE